MPDSFLGASAPDPVCQPLVDVIGGLDGGAVADFSVTYNAFVRPVLVLTAPGCYSYPDDADRRCCSPNPLLLTRPSQVETANAIEVLNGEIAKSNTGMDLMWLVLGGALVFFMHSGFSLLEVGSVSVRNTQNILFKNIISPTVAGILFWFCGYSFAYVRHLTRFTCSPVSPDCSRRPWRSARPRARMILTARAAQPASPAPQRLNLTP